MIQWFDDDETGRITSGVYKGRLIRVVFYRQWDESHCKGEMLMDSGWAEIASLSFVHGENENDIKDMVEEFVEKYLFAPID